MPTSNEKTTTPRQKRKDLSTPHLRKLQKERQRRWRAKNKERAQVLAREAFQRFKAKKPTQVKVNRQVSLAIRRGKIKKEPCKICGEKKVEAHHNDYSKPLDIMWLCKKHHAEWHIMFKAKNG